VGIDALQGAGWIRFEVMDVVAVRLRVAINDLQRLGQGKTFPFFGRHVTRFYVLRRVFELLAKWTIQLVSLMMSTLT
jgi:hypothetical protein